MQENALLTVGQLADALGLPRSWVYNQAQRGLLPGYKIGKYVRFRREEVQNWLAEHRHGQHAAGAER